MEVFGRKRKPKLGPGKKLSASAWSGKSIFRRRNRRDKSGERCSRQKWIGGGAILGRGLTRAGPSSGSASSFSSCKLQWAQAWIWRRWDTEGWVWAGMELSPRIAPAGGELRIRSGFEPN